MVGWDTVKFGIGLLCIVDLGDHFSNVVVEDDLVSLFVIFGEVVLY